jgi:hypothetical protein
MVGLVSCACSGDVLPEPPPGVTIEASEEAADTAASDQTTVSDPSDQRTPSASSPESSTLGEESVNSSASQPDDGDPASSEMTTQEVPAAASPQGAVAAQPSGETSTIFQVEDMEIGGQYAESISAPFEGVALYADGDSVTLEHTFPALPGSYRADVTGASSNNRAATAELRLGERSLGNVTFRGTASSVQTIEFEVRAATPATRTLTLTAINDNNTWDLFVDQIELTLVEADTAAGQL